MLASMLRRCLTATALLLVAAPLRTDTLKVPAGRSTVKDNGGDGIQVALTTVFNQPSESRVTGNGHDGIDNSGSETSLVDNQCKDSGGADLAGAGDGPDTVNLAESTGNTVSDDSDIVAFTTLGELENLP